MSALSRILLVEDDAALRCIAKLALEQVGGFVVQDCASGPEALSCAANFAPDLILLDVMMPGMDGPSTMKALKRRAEVQAVPVVFLTARVQKKEVQALQSSGALGVLSKPFDPLTLSAQVLELWNMHTA